MRRRVGVVIGLDLDDHAAGTVNHKASPRSARGDLMDPS